MTCFPAWTDPQAFLGGGVSKYDFGCSLLEHW